MLKNRFDEDISMDGPSTTVFNCKDSTEDSAMQDLFITLDSVPDSPTPAHSPTPHPTSTHHSFANTCPDPNSSDDAPVYPSTDLTLVPWITLPPSPQPQPSELPPLDPSSSMTVDLPYPEPCASSNTTLEPEDDDSWEQMSNPDPVQEFWTRPRNDDNLRGLINYLPVITSDAALLRAILATRLAEYQNVQIRIREVRTQIAYVDRQLMAYAAFEEILNSMHENETRQ